MKEIIESIKWRIFKIVFPRYYNALRFAMELSLEYWQESPDPHKQYVGRDIYTSVNERYLKLR
jgi:hypothetical protein